MAARRLTHPWACRAAPRGRPPVPTSRSDPVPLPPALPPLRRGRAGRVSRQTGDTTTAQPLPRWGVRWAVDSGLGIRLRVGDLNPGPLAYEASELPLLQPAALSIGYRYFRMASGASVWVMAGVLRRFHHSGGWCTERPRAHTGPVDPLTILGYPRTRHSGAFLPSPLF
jgi:hypothetical protein